MKKLVATMVLMLTTQTALCGENSVAFFPLVNEVSIYQNVSDNGDDLGQTLQIVSINSIKLIYQFNVEFTADFNRKFTEGEDHDYYLEFGLVKPVWKKLSVNYQRIHGTFIPDAVNQFGMRYSF